jgi:hypothetical protein
MHNMADRLRIALCAIGIVSAAACGASPITAARIERAVAPAFANLVHLQLVRLGLPAIAASDINVRATCRKLVPESGPAGAGEWVCTLVWHGPNRETLRDTYDLSVGTDGCYNATIESTEANLGGPTITGPDGISMRNLLYSFEGCFDTT